MYGIILGIFFLVPIYYRAKAKGYNGGALAGLAAGLGLASFLLSIGVMAWLRLLFNPID
jgi:hypothetical protein